MAIRAQTEQLQPVFLDFVAGFPRNGCGQRIKIVTFKEGDFAAILA